MDEKIVDPFVECGYQRIRDWLVKGPVLDLSYQERDISGYLLWRQRIHPEEDSEMPTKRLEKWEE